MLNLNVYVCPIRNQNYHQGPLSREAKTEIMTLAGTVTSPFIETTISWNLDDLDGIFNGPYVTSPHENEKGIRDKAKYVKTNFILIDVDNGLAVNKCREFLDNHKHHMLYYMNFSANSQVEMPKYHIVMPLSRPVVGDEHSLLVDWLIQQFACLNPDRSVLNDRARGIIRGNPDFKGYLGGQTVLDTDLILAEVRSSAAKAVSAGVINKEASQRFALTGDLEVQLENEKGPWARLKDLDAKTKPRILCPVCGHRSDLRSAVPGQLTHNSTFATNSKGVPMIYCSSCEGRGWGKQGNYNFRSDDPLVAKYLKDDVAYADYFYLGNHLCKVFNQGQRISVDKVSERAIDINDSEAKNALLAELAKQAKSTEIFRVNHLGDPSASALSYTWNGAVIDARYPLTPVVSQDNAGVDAYLEFLFGKHADAIRDWLAVYVHTNLQPKLPAILLNGPQGTGKTTFAELVMNTYPGLGEIRGSKGEEYTSEYACKCMLIDENTKNKKSDLYTEIKELTGNKSLMVNTKYGLKYRVDNNLNVIVTTNAEKILHFEAGEEPMDPSNNRFGVFRLEKPLPASLLQRAQDGWGHYCRTTLKVRWDGWLKDDIATRKHRFGIACPITDELTRQFALSVTRLDQECEQLADAIVNGTGDYLGIRAVDTRTDQAGREYIMASVLKTTSDDLFLKFDQGAILQRMHQKGWMGSRKQREGGTGMMLGYPIHRDRMKRDLGI